METAEGSVPDAPSDARLSYLLYSASLGAFYFVPLIGTLSLSDLSRAALSTVARRPLYLSTSLVFSIPFIVSALAWGLGARRGMRAGFAALCKELTWFVVVQAALFIVMCRWSRGDEGRRLIVLWMIACLGQVLYAAKRCVRIMRESFGLAPPRPVLALFTLAFGLFEFALFISGWRGALLETVYSSGRGRSVDYAIRVPPEPPGGTRDDAAPDYQWARQHFSRLNRTLFARAQEDLRGDWKDPGGDWAAALLKNRAALASFRAAALRSDCDLQDPFKSAEWYGDPAPDLRYIVDLTLLILIDARRAEAEGRFSDAADDYAVALLTARHMLQQRRTKAAGIYAAVASGIVRSAWVPLSRYLEKDLGSAADDARLLDALVRLDRDRPAPGADALADLRRWFAYRRRQLESSPSAFRSGLLADALTARDEEVRRADEAFAAAARGEPAALARYLDDLRVRHRWLFVDSAALAQDRPDYCGYHPGKLGACWGFLDARWASTFMPAALEDRIAVARTRVLAAAAAVRLREKNGHPAPRSLDEAPMDPFADGPLRYSVDPRGRWMVYSVGPDRKDDKAESLFAAESVKDWRTPPPGDIVLRGSP